MSEVQTEQASKATMNPRIEQLINLFNKADEDGWLDDNLGVVEKMIKLLPKQEPKHSKQRSYAIRRLEAAEYRRAREAGEVPKAITEEQILAEMARMEQEKVKKNSKKAQ